MTDLIVIGSGLYGLTVARLAAERFGLKVAIVEKRNHIGGNAYSEFEPTTQIEHHVYGSHLFHTSNERVWAFANRFTTFNSYQHRVWTIHQNKVYPMPVNLATICEFFGYVMSPDEAYSLIQGQRVEVKSSKITNLEEKAISLIGKPLYEAFIKNYTAKQWQTDPQDLPPEIINRLPVRYDFNNRYFNDKYEGLPISGYTAWLENIADHKNISVQLSTDFFEIRDSIDDSLPIVYTGPLDRFFNYELGVLGWRTLDFEMEIHQVSDFQGTSVMNYADLDVPFTRIHEFKHLHPERDYTSDATLIVKEYSRFANEMDDPYYPINSSSDRSRLQGYRAMSEQLSNVWFGGRLGTYQYLDMHMAIASAITLIENQLGNIFATKSK